MKKEGSQVAAVSAECKHFVTLRTEACAVRIPGDRNGICKHNYVETGLDETRVPPVFDRGPQRGINREIQSITKGV